MKRILLLSFALSYSLSGNTQVVDSSFGVNGYVEVTTNLGYITANKGRISSMAVQPDGKIVAGIDLMDPNSGDYYYYTRRYNPNGSFDSSFATAGTSKIFFGDKCINEDLFIQPDGKIVSIGNGEYCINGVCGNRNLAMFRYKPNGTLDSSFGDDGILLTNQVFGTGNYCIPKRVRPATGGKYIIAGQGINGKPFVARLHQDGSLDISFGSGGKFTDTAFSAALADIETDASGNIFALIRRFNGSVYDPNPQDIAVVKLNPDGTLAANFGLGGMAIFNFDEFDEPEAIALTPQGKIAIAGSVSPVYDWADSGTVGFIALIEPDGSLAGSIPGGCRRFRYPADSVLYFKDMHALSNNGFLLNGISDTRDPDGRAGWKAILFRVSADLTPDTSFNHTGWMRFNYGYGNGASNYFAAFHKTAILPNGDILAGGHRNIVLNGGMGTFLLKLKNVPGVTTSVAEAAPFSALRIYPNPSAGVINIESPEAGSVRIVDMSGRTVYQSAGMAAAHELSVSHLPAGVYHVRLQRQNGLFSAGSFIKH